MQQQIGVYSFSAVHASLAGPGGIISLGAGSANADEGITIEPVEDANLPKTGADGSVMNTRNSVKAAKIVVHLLKTSPVNSLLSAMFNLQSLDPLLWGVNVFVLNDKLRGDEAVGQGVAFTKHPGNQWAKEGNMIQWELYAAVADQLLGKGT